MTDKETSQPVFSDLPEGTITFLFTDIEGSTQLLKQLGSDRYGLVLSEQRHILKIFAIKLY